MRTGWKLVVLGAALAFLLPAASASKPGVAAPQRLNIVFILTDDQTVDSLAKMPFVSQYKNWVTFKNAFINDPICCPSRATILSGLYSHHTGVENNGDRKKFNDSSTIATWLHAAGYETALIGKYHLGTHKDLTYVPPGWDDWESFRDAAYYNYVLNVNGKLVNYGSTPKSYSTDVLGQKAVDFVKRQTVAKPFFLYFATFSPHDGYSPAVRYANRFKDEPIPHTPSFNEADMSDKPAWWRALQPVKLPDIDDAHREEFASLLAVDDWVKAIFDTLRAKGFLNNTAVFFMTDNGFSFGEHRWRGKACAYEACVRTPFLVSWPGVRQRTVSALISNIDMAPTFADIAHAKPTIKVDGRTLVPVITGTTPKNWPRQILLQWKNDRPSMPPSFWAVRTPRYKYIETVPSGERELYDFSKDPDETQNVAGQPAYAKIAAALRQRLLAMRTTPAHAATPPETTITSGPRGRARAGRTVTFRFRSSEPGSVFQCRLAMTVLWKNCASPKRYRRLATGSKVFQVRAIDANGNVDETPAQRFFSVR